MKAKELLDAGKVREAEKVLSAFLRDNPADTALRIFLFELLCFSGQYERAEKQLGVLAKGSPEAEMGAVLVLLRLARRKDPQRDVSEAGVSRSSGTRLPCRER
jgi:type VI secretion system protein ImpE